MRIKIYTTPSCQYCKMAKHYFNELDLDYEEVNVAEDKEALKEMVDKSHQLGVPVIEIGNEIFVGFNKEAIDKVINS